MRGRTLGITFAVICLLLTYVVYDQGKTVDSQREQIHGLYDDLTHTHTTPCAAPKNMKPTRAPIRALQLQAI